MSTTTQKTVNFQDTVFSNTTEWNWEDLGKLKSHVLGWGLRFTKKNLTATDGRCVVIIGTPKGGTPKNIYCTKPLSAKIREAIKGGMTHIEALKVVLNYDLKVNADDNSKVFVFQPQGSQMPELEVTQDVVSLEGAAF